MRVIVDSYPTDHPSDVSKLEQILSALPIDKIERLALIGKTEGTATINDFSRELAVDAVQTSIRHFGGDELLGRSTIIFSTGCEGILSPSVYVLATIKDEEDLANGPCQLTMGGAQTRILAAEELATNVQIKLVAGAVNAALNEAALKPDQTSLVLVKSPILTPNDAALTGDPVVMSRAGISGLSRGAAALGVAIALDELKIENDICSILATLDVNSNFDINKYPNVGSDGLFKLN